MGGGTSGDPLRCGIRGRGVIVQGKHRNVRQGCKARNRKVPRLLPFLEAIGGAARRKDRGNVAGGREAGKLQKRGGVLASPRCESDNHGTEPVNFGDSIRGRGKHINGVLHRFECTWATVDLAIVPSVQFEPCARPVAKSIMGAMEQQIFRFAALCFGAGFAFGAALAFVLVLCFLRPAFNRLKRAVEMERAGTALYVHEPQKRRSEVYAGGLPK